MSRGLGKLQRSILASLNESRCEDRYRGIDCHDTRCVLFRGWTIRLAAGVFDMRAVQKCLARKAGKVYCGGGNYVRDSFQASFCRAMHGLVSRGYLQFPSLIPVIEAERLTGSSESLHVLSDGLFVIAGTERRFATLSKNAIMYSAYADGAA